MQCLKCRRPLVRFAASIEINGTTVGWGPDCSRQVGASLMKTTRGPRAAHAKATAPLPQLDMFEAAPA